MTMSTNACTDYGKPTDWNKEEQWGWNQSERKAIHFVPCTILSYLVVTSKIEDTRYSELCFQSHFHGYFVSTVPLGSPVQTRTYSTSTAGAISCPEWAQVFNDGIRLHTWLYPIANNVYFVNPAYGKAEECQKGKQRATRLFRSLFWTRTDTLMHGTLHEVNSREITHDQCMNN